MLPKAERVFFLRFTLILLQQHSIHNEQFKKQMTNCNERIHRLVRLLTGFFASVSSAATVHVKEPPISPSSRSCIRTTVDCCLRSLHFDCKLLLMCLLMVSSSLVYYCLSLVFSCDCCWLIAWLVGLLDGCRTRDHYHNDSGDCKINGLALKRRRCWKSMGI